MENLDRPDQNTNSGNIEFNFNTFNFEQCLDDIFQDVFYNYASIIKEKCKAFESYGLNNADLDKDLTSYFTPSSKGLILIDGVNYNIDKKIFKIIDIATHEKIKGILTKNFGSKFDDKTFSRKLLFQKKLEELRKLQNRYKGERVRIDDFCVNYNYPSLEYYIYSLIGGSILGEYILFSRESTIYKDLKKAEV